MAPQVLDIKNLEAAVFHGDDRVGQARNPATGKNVLADEELRLETPEVADEVEHAEAAWPEQLGVGADHFGQLIAPGVLEHADRYHLVERAARLPEVRLSHRQPIGEPTPPDLVAQPMNLLRRGVDPGAQCTGRFQSTKHEAAEPAADVDVALALGEPQLAADVIDLVALRLLERRRSGGPVAARVHHQRVVEPQAIELGPQAVVRPGIGLGLGRRGVRMAKLVQQVL